MQNTDNEWNDAREALCAVALYEYYLDTGRWEYLERAVAAMHGGFQNLPFENWAHCGYEGMQYDSSLLWGCGIILAAAEYFDKKMEMISVDVKAGKAIGLWGIQVTDVAIGNSEIHIQARIPKRLGKKKIGAGVYQAAGKKYQVFLNGKPV